VMEELAAKMPGLIALRDALYSDDFKSWVQDVTGCGELSDKVADLPWFSCGRNGGA